MTNLILELLTRAWKLVFNHELFKTAFEKESLHSCFGTSVFSFGFTGTEINKITKLIFTRHPRAFCICLGCSGFRVTLIQIMENNYSNPSTTRPQFRRHFSLDPKLAKAMR